MDDFFNKNEIIFYQNIHDLSDKIKFYIKMIKRKKNSQQVKNILNYSMN